MALEGDLDGPGSLRPCKAYSLRASLYVSTSCLLRHPVHGPIVLARHRVHLGLGANTSCSSCFGLGLCLESCGDNSDENKALGELDIECNGVGGIDVGVRTFATRMNYCRTRRGYPPVPRAMTRGVTDVTGRVYFI